MDSCAALVSEGYLNLCCTDIRICILTSVDGARSVVSGSSIHETKGSGFVWILGLRFLLIFTHTLLQLITVPTDIGRTLPYETRQFHC